MGDTPWPIFAPALIPNAVGLPAQMPADKLTGDAQLLPLADNGGAILTMR